MKAKYYTLARSDELLDDLLSMPTNSREAKHEYMSRFRENGIRLVQKNQNSPTSSFNIALASKLVRLRYDFELLSDKSQASILAHEWVHVAQRWHYGKGRFGLKYFFNPRFGLCMELQAYRQSLRISYALGASERTLESNAKRYVSNLWKKYPFKSIGHEKLTRFARQILMDEVKRICS